MPVMANTAAVVVTTSVHSTTNTHTEREGDFCWAVQNQSCIYFMTVGGFYGVIVLAIYVCLRRGNTIFACLLFFFVFLPVGFKITWDKFQRWQARKRAMHQNAETFDRLNTYGREDPAGPRRSSSRRSVNGPSADPSRTSASFTNNYRSPPPKYGDLHPTDLPPSYAEAVEMYGVPADLENATNVTPDSNQSNVTGEPDSNTETSNL